MPDYYEELDQFLNEYDRPPDVSKDKILLDRDPAHKHEFYLARRRTDNGTYYHTQISNFRFRIHKNILNVETKKIAREILIEGARTTDLFELDADAAFAPAKIQSFCFARGQYFIEATKKDLLEIWKLEVEEGPKDIIKQSDYLGFIPSLNCWIFGDSLITQNDDKEWNTILPTEEKIFVLDGETTLTYRALSESSGRIPQLQTVKEELTLQKTTELFFTAQFQKGQLVLAWLAALAFLPEIVKKYGKFPLLFLSGITQSGKTWLASCLMQCCGIFSEGVKVKETSPYGITLLLSYFSALPVWLDEYLVNEKSSQELNHFLKNIYDRQSTIKGALNNKIREYFVRGAMVVTGEEFPNVHSVLSRCICLELSKNGRGDPELMDSHRHLLPQVFEKLLKKKSAQRTRRFFRYQKRLQAILQKEIQDFRIAFNYSLIIAAFRVMFGRGQQREGRDVLNTKGRNRPETFTRWAVQYAGHDQIAKEADTWTTQFLFDVIGMIDEGLVKEEVLYKCEQQETAYYIFLSIQDIYRRWEEFSARRQRTKTYTYKTLLRDFREEPYYVRKKSESPKRSGLKQKEFIVDFQLGTSKRRPCVCLDIAKMSQPLQDTFLGMLGTDPEEFQAWKAHYERQLADGNA